MKIVVIGSGYVGLVSGTCFAEMGHHVICLDIDQAKIALLNKGEIPIFEPGLQEMVEKNMAAKRLSFTSSYQEAFKKVDVIFIAVATDSREDGSCNLVPLFSAVSSIAAHSPKKENLLVVNKSTSPPGTAHKIEAKLKELSPTCSFLVVSNPEFLKEGSAVSDCMKPDRIIIGSDTQKGADLLTQLYAPFCFSHDRMLVMSTLSAELTKYAANAMLASRISLMNELSLICDEVGANIHDIRVGIGSDKRIGYHFLYAGAGYGGSCFPKDIKALRSLAKSLEIETPMLSAVEAVNEQQKKRVAEKIKSHFGPNLQGKEIAIWGLSFKPDTDDIREAPAIELINILLKHKAKLKLFDPVSMPKMQTLYPPSSQISYASTEYEAAKNCDAIALITEWKQFRFVDLREIGEGMKEKVFFDGRNQYKPELLKEHGFTYYGMGVAN